MLSHVGNILAARVTLCEFMQYCAVIHISKQKSFNQTTIHYSPQLNKNHSQSILEVFSVTAHDTDHEILPPSPDVHLIKLPSTKLHNNQMKYETESKNSDDKSTDVYNDNDNENNNNNDHEKKNDEDVKDTEESLKEPTLSRVESLHVVDISDRVHSQNQISNNIRF